MDGTAYDRSTKAKDTKEDRTDYKEKYEQIGAEAAREGARRMERKQKEIEAQGGEMTPEKQSQYPPGRGREDAQNEPQLDTDTAMNEKGRTRTRSSRGKRARTTKRTEKAKARSTKRARRSSSRKQ
jgi:hypothetical protein